ncbi:winged helix-turn-helix transcriptional regulator [Undibacterium sp. TC9W]|uniref:winged helix-turn-helix transcriptional regulator n=1 Tax=Undibacterium sp. TC9W TaxID=3413053 RepID=UPI003BF1334B
MRQQILSDAFLADCPIIEVLDQLSDKWSVLVMARVVKSPIRFNELKRDMRGISQKVLAQTLKKLVRFGLIERTAYATVPVTVEYEITPLGISLAAIVNELRIWSVKHCVQIRAAQQKFDAEHKQLED